MGNVVHIACSDTHPHSTLFIKSHVTSNHTGQIYFLPNAQHSGVYVLCCSPESKGFYSNWKGFPSLLHEPGLNKEDHNPLLMLAYKRGPRWRDTRKLNQSSILEAVRKLK